MMTLTLFNFYWYIWITWGSNVALNLLYVLKRYIPQTKRFDAPIDANIRIQGARLVGDSTTVLGIVVTGVVSAGLYFFGSVVWFTPFLVYSGHLLGSFIKRRIGKEDGSFVPVVDHGDYMIVSGVVLSLLGYISWGLCIAGLIFTYIAHPVACIVAFRLKMREYPY